MNTIIPLRRLLPLTLILIAAIFTPAVAHAQSSAQVQIKRADTGLAAKALPDLTVGFAVDNDNDFSQRWTRELASSPNVYRLSRAGFLNACIRVPDGLSPNDAATMKRGSCSGPLALWRETSFNGAKLYRNPTTGHYLYPSFCFGLCAEGMDVVPRPIVDAFGGLQFATWKLDFLG